MTGTTDSGNADPQADPSAAGADNAELTDPGAKTQPAEGGRDEATDGGGQQPLSDETGN